MARQASTIFTLPSGEVVRAGWTVRRGYVRVRLRDPKDATRYVEHSTGVTVPRNWKAGDDVPAEAHTAAAKLVVKLFSTATAPTPKSVTWEQVEEQLPTAAPLRERTLKTYLSAIHNFRAYVPTSNGPGDVTPAVARKFRHDFGSGYYTKSTKKGAKKYPRSAKTTESAIRRLSGLWGHLKKIELATTDPWENVPRPTVPKKVPTAPTEDDVNKFFAWVDGLNWPLMSTFLRLKSYLGCRTADLSQLTTSQFDPKAGTLTINPDQDKTHRQRVVPLTPELVAALKTLAGPTYLWEKYTEDAKTHRPGRRNKDAFTPSLVYWAVLDLFSRYNEAHPDRRPIRSHDLRRRAITLVVQATGSVDAASDMLGVHPTTVRSHYLDTKQAFDSATLMKRLAGVLVPPVTESRPAVTETA